MKIYFYEHLVGTFELIDIDFHYCMEIKFKLENWVKEPKSIFAKELNKRIYQLEEYTHRDFGDVDNHNTYKNEHYSRGLYIEFNNVIYNFNEYDYQKKSNTIFTGTLNVELNRIEEFMFFWETKHPFSQWHKCTFKENGKTYNTAEQYMMYHKALLFGDNQIAEKILTTSDPRKCKSLGRLVSNFNEEIWKENRFEIVYNGNFLKFSQNENLRNELIKTKGKTIVEASPDDKIWGIGMTSENKSRTDRKK